MNPPMNWVPVILVCPVLACSGFVVWFCVLFGFVLCVFAVCLVYDDDGPMDYVQVLPQFSFAALNSRWPGTLICITAHAMSYSVVNDLAKAMKALDGKKNTSKTGWISTPKQEKNDFETLFKRIFKGKFIAPKLIKSADKSLSQPGCSHSNTIYDVQLQKTIVLCMQPRHRATLTQPLQCDLQRLSC